MRTEVSTHGIAADEGLRSRAGSFIAGLLLLSAGSMIKFVPAVSGFVLQNMPGIYNFMMDIGWVLLVCMSVGAFIGMRRRKNVYSAVRVYEEGIGAVTAGGNEVYADYGQCQIYLAIRNGHEDISIKSARFPQPVKFGMNDLQDYELFVEKVQRYGEITRIY